MGAEITTQRHWQAPDQLRIKREAGFGYRYIKKADVERRIDEGWELVTSALRQHKEGGAVEKAQHYRGLILMKMPQDMIDQRNKHYAALHNRRLRAVARGANMTSVSRAATSVGSETDDGRPLAGTIGQGLKVRQGAVMDDGAITHTDNIDIPLAAHPDDLRDDMRVASEMKAEQAADSGEGEVQATSKTKTKKRR